MVAGGSRRRHSLTGTAATGFSGPGAAARARNRDAFLLLDAGPRAHLLEPAHPFVAEGVARHRAALLPATRGTMPQALAADRRFAALAESARSH